MKSPRTHFPWLMRAVLGIGTVALLLAALGSRPAAAPPVPTPTAMVVQVEAVPAPPVPTPRPTATTEPYVEHIISRISRETQAPYPTSTPLPADIAVVNIVDFAYLPGVTRIHVGQTVVWSNGGREEHDVTGDDDWHSGPIEPPMDYRHTFGFAGTFTYSCSVHRDMHGTIIVSP